MEVLRVLAVTGHKGGTGKSKTVTGLAAYAAERGERVVVLDLDPQCTSAKWGDRREPDVEKRESANPAVLAVPAARVSNVLETARRAGVTLAIIDTPPKNADAALAALREADYALLPLRPEIEDVETLADVKSLLMLGGNPLAHVVFTQCPTQGEYETEAASAVKAQGFEVCPVTIHIRRDFANCGVSGQGATEYAPKSKAAQEIRELYEFTCEQLNSQTGVTKHGKGTRAAKRA